MFAPRITPERRNTDPTQNPRLFDSLLPRIIQLPLLFDPCIVHLSAVSGIAVTLGSCELE